MPTVDMPVRANVHTYFDERPTLDHTRKTPKTQYGELQALTNQGGRLSAFHEQPYVDRVTLCRFDQLNALHPHDTHELTERRVYDDAIRHFHTMAAPRQAYDVADIMKPSDNVKMAFYRRTRPYSPYPNAHSTITEPIAALERVIKDEKGREPEALECGLRSEGGLLDNVTNRPLLLRTAHEFPVESLLRNLSEKHGRITVAHFDNYMTNGTPIENEHAKAYAFDFGPPPAYQAAYQRDILDQLVVSNEETSPAITGQGALNGSSTQRGTEGLWPIFGLPNDSNGLRTGQTHLLPTQVQGVTTRLPALEQKSKRDRSRVDMSDID